MPVVPTVAPVQLIIENRCPQIVLQLRNLWQTLSQGLGALRRLKLGYKGKSFKFFLH